jgi:hypothetical protein
VGDVSNDDKLDKFRADVAQLKLHTGGQRRDTILQVVGALLMLAGLVVALVTYEASLNQSSALNIGSEQILATAMLALTVIGAALFVFASLARFLRLWLLRQLYEGQAHLDQLMEAVRPPV